MKVVVFIDVQKDFIKQGALAYGFPKADIVPDIIKFAKKCKAEGCMMFATRDTHKGNYMETLEGARLPVPHCIAGTPGHELADGLEIPVSNIVDKPSFGSYVLPVTIDYTFEDMCHTPIDKIVVCGFCTSICVVSNALMLRAWFRETPIEVVENLCGDIDEASHAAALQVMRNCQIDVVSETL